MATTYISEIDSTSPGVSTTSTYVVLIPGTCEKTGVEAGDEFDFVDTGTEFQATFDRTAEANNLSYKIAYHLLELGLPVHYVVIDDESDLYDVDSGDDKYSSFWKKFADKGSYDLRFITAGGYRHEGIAENVLRCAAERGDAVGIVDDDNDCDTSADIENYAQTIVGHVVTRKDGTTENSLAYGAMFTPDFTFDSPYFKNDTTTKYPASFGYLAAFAYHNLKEFPEWFATAGAIRGVLPYSNVKPEIKFGDADNALLQNRETAGNRGVNPIQLVRPYGNIIWGARTLYPNAADDNGKGYLKASSFLNIRQLCCSIKKELYKASKKFTFDPNSDTLWINFKSAVKPLLEEMKTNQGIKGYRFIKQTSKEKATLTARIQIIPIEPVEDFYLTVHMVDSIVDVSE